jgi:hypothetical protein
MQAGVAVPTGLKNRVAVLLMDGRLPLGGGARGSQSMRSRYMASGWPSAHRFLTSSVISSISGPG